MSARISFSRARLPFLIITLNAALEAEAFDACNEPGRSHFPHMALIPPSLPATALHSCQALLTWCTLCVLSPGGDRIGLDCAALVWIGEIGVSRD
jgi:hypothetical protein